MTALVQMAQNFLIGLLLVFLIEFIVYQSVDYYFKRTGK